MRIENLCTIVRSKKRPGFLEVVPLTFSPLDARLIDRELLREDERRWLAEFEGRFSALPERSRRPSPARRSRSA